MTILLGLILICACGILYLLYQIIKQQGRLLLRLDGIEQRLGIRAPDQPAGLAVGSRFPDFELPDLSGTAVSSASFRGKRLLVINWSPGCGFCTRIAAELAKLQTALGEHQVALVLAAHGEAEANRKAAEEQGLAGAILLQSDGQAVTAFQSMGTPAAYLLDAAGLVAKPVAIGAEQVPLLARYAAGCITEAEFSSGKPVKHSTCGQAAKQAPEGQAMQGAGPGTELRKLLARIGLHPTPDCPCNERALLMDLNGSEWCEQNMDTIVAWLREEAERRGLPFIERGARFIVRRAITNDRQTPSEERRESNILIQEEGLS